MLSDVHLATKYDPSQLRDPGGEGGGQWVKTIKIGGRVELSAGVNPTTGKPVPGPVKGTVVRLSETQVMINAGSKAKPRWVAGRRGDAKTVERAKPAQGVGPGRRGYWSRLSDKERDAVDSYKGYGYKQINSRLRAGNAASEMVRQLDSAIAKGSLGGDTKLYRSFHMENIPKAGDVISDRGFASTSTRREVAERFTKIGGGRRAMVRISVPAGTPAAFLPGQNEDEVLLGRDSNFAVKSVKTEGGILVVDVEVVSNGQGQ
jgi:hypothetical protein